MYRLLIWDIPKYSLLISFLYISLYAIIGYYIDMGDLASF